MEDKRNEVTSTVSNDTVDDAPQNKHAEQEYCDARVERRVKWKLDLTILPLLTSIYFLSQLVLSAQLCMYVFSSS